jgi:8-oxo-dGTP diphosphatase
VTSHYAEDDHLGGRTLLVAAAYTILLRDGAVLLHLRRGTGYRDGFWALPAGHVDPGESVLDAAAREVAEEVGVEVRAVRPVVAMHRFERGGPAVEQRIDLFFEAVDWSGEAVVLEPDKSAGLGWFPLDELPEPVVPHERRVLDALASGEPLPAVVVWRTDLEGA